MKKPPGRLEVLCTGILAAALVACGGEVVGIGNSDNRIGTGGLAEEVAAAFAQDPATPEVTDAMVAKIFSALLERAAAGDPQAALIVLSIGRQQRDAAED